MLIYNIYVQGEAVKAYLQGVDLNCEEGRSVNGSAVVLTLFGSVHLIFIAS
jgi:hypothetical protein